MSGAPDPLESYLDELSRRLTGPGHEVRSVLAEYDSHLRDAVDAARAMGLGEDEARSAALRRFGTPAQVAAAANAATWSRVRRPMVRAAAGTLVRLAATAMVAAGGSAVVAYALAAMTSPQAVYGLPARVQATAARAPTGSPCSRAPLTVTKPAPSKLLVT
jgi:hypothetical protein